MKHYKILIADDDTELIKMLKQFLEIKNYEVMTAKNGAKALEMAQMQPNLILLDVNMPDLDGMEVCRRIRDKVSCPILFLTARAEEEDSRVVTELVRRIRNKLKEHTGQEYIETVWGMGYRWIK